MIYNPKHLERRAGKQILDKSRVGRDKSPGSRVQQAGTTQLLSGLQCLLLKCKITTDQLDLKEHREPSHTAPLQVTWMLVIWQGVASLLMCLQQNEKPCRLHLREVDQLLFVQLALKHPFIYLNLTH